MNKNTEKRVYTGLSLDKLYKMACVGARFAVVKSENGVSTVNSLLKELYIKSALLSKFTDIIAVGENEVISLDEYNEYLHLNDNNIVSVGKTRLKADFDIFKSMLDTEINNILIEENDTLIRFEKEIALNCTPERIKDLQEQKEKVMELLDKREVVNG